MKRWMIAAGAAALLAGCSTSPPAPVAMAPAPPPKLDNDVPYQWTLGNAPQAHKDLVSTFGRVGLKPGEYLWTASIPSDGELRVVSEFPTAEPKTKLMRQALDAIAIKRSVLLVDNTANKNLELSSRNLEGVKLVASRDVNVYDLLGHNQVLLSETAARKLSEALA